MIAKQRANELSQRKDVLSWVNKFDKLASEMPSDIWVFVGAGVPTVLAYNESGGIYETKQGSVDQDASIFTLDRGKGSWDGGDW